MGFTFVTKASLLPAELAWNAPRVVGKFVEKVEMIKAPICLQDLRRSLYVKAKAEPTWRFWGLYVHVCKMETLHEAYRAAKKNDGAPGIDGVTFDAIEEGGVESFLQQIKDELVSNTYRPMGLRKKEIPKDGGKVRILWGRSAMVVPTATIIPGPKFWLQTSVGPANIWRE